MQDPFTMLNPLQRVGTQITARLRDERGRKLSRAARRAEAQRRLAEVGIDDSKDTIALCRIGERSSLTWFVLKELLGHQNVKNYDGSWTEYGSLVGVPIALGDEPGEA